MGTAVQHPVPERVKPLFVIFDIWVLWRLAPSFRVGLYRIFFSNLARARFCWIWILEWQIRPAPDFQIDCNFSFTNLMCVKIINARVFEFLIIFCAAVTVTTFLILDFLLILAY